MPRTVIYFDNATLKIADDAAGIDTGDAYECQTTAAALVPTSSTVPIPATACAPVSNKPVRATWQLQLAVLQDWTSPGGGLMNYSVVNDTKLKYFQLVQDKAGTPTVSAEGFVFVSPGQFGGSFDGSPATATMNWDVDGTPVFAVPPDAVTAAASSTEPTLDDALAEV